ncbi:uncharacterized protein LOC133360121 [Lethenteron reissneri]|uniref:uncharacterized protein LOC133360121 n=1 Tax=Lethenteron reissneri TaxID=7753 RepID=UPI002AB6CC60|nr:uncharacterized protein LOC133360121 [Lethenteron reissneri]
MRRRRRGGGGGGGGVMLVLVSFGVLVIAAAGLARASQLDLPGEEIDFISEQLKERSLQDAAPAPRSAPLGPDGRGSPNASAVTSAAAPGPVAVDKGQSSHNDPATDTLFLIILIACVVTGTAGLILAVVCCCYMQRSAKKAEKAGYPAFGATAGHAEPSKGLARIFSSLTSLLATIFSSENHGSSKLPRGGGGGVGGHDRVTRTTMRTTMVTTTMIAVRRHASHGA